MEEFFTAIENHQKTSIAVAVFLIILASIVSDTFKNNPKH